MDLSSLFLAFVALCFLTFSLAEPAGWWWRERFGGSQEFKGSYIIHRDPITVHQRMMKECTITETKRKVFRFHFHSQEVSQDPYRDLSWISPHLLTIKKHRKRSHDILDAFSGCLVGWYGCQPLMWCRQNWKSKSMKSGRVTRLDKFYLLCVTSCDRISRRNVSNDQNRGFLLYIGYGISHEIIRIRSSTNQDFITGNLSWVPTPAIPDPTVLREYMNQDTVIGSHGRGAFTC